MNHPRRAKRRGRTIRLWRLGSLPRARTAAALFFAFALCGCRRYSREPVTVTFLDPEWLHDSNTATSGLSGSLRKRRLISDTALQEFSQETEIQVKHLPTPENPRDQLILIRSLLQNGSVTPDVYAIDVIWPGMLNQYLVDLKPYFASQLRSENREVLANYTVQDQLAAMPYHAHTGVLFYRTDLLHKYGYSRPPETWDELEKMALRIQEGERAQGEKDFWGYVWPGAAKEGLLCNALEWQFDEGGGRIIEDNKKISVNNPAAIRSWERAAHWLGWISPSSVTAYQELDAGNIFWISGKAAFFRGWASSDFLREPPDVPFRDRGGVTSVPGGNFARGGTVGGYGLAVSRWSAHPAESIRLIESLRRREDEIRASLPPAEPSPRQEMYELPILLSEGGLSAGGEKPGSRILARPSKVTGANYDDVAEAYIQAVHGVLTGKSKAPAAAAALEKQLVRITGFETGRPAKEF